MVSSLIATEKKKKKTNGISYKEQLWSLANTCTIKVCHVIKNHKKIK